MQREVVEGLVEIHRQGAGEDELAERIGHDRAVQVGRRPTLLGEPVDKEVRNGAAREARLDEDGNRGEIDAVQDRVHVGHRAEAQAVTGGASRAEIEARFRMQRQADGVLAARQVL